MNIFLILFFIVNYIPHTPMAAMVSDRRVSGNFQGFHQIHGDATALSMVGVDRFDGFGGYSDNIVIRKIANLTPSAARKFDLGQAIAIAPKAKFSISTRLLASTVTSVCGHRAFAFVSIERVTLPGATFPLPTGDLIRTHVLVVINRELWQAVYSRTYTLSLEKNGEANLIGFTSQFCVQ